MSKPKRTDTQSPVLPVADRHDLIRVQGARVNNLKDVSVELPKRRLTVFTGVSGSGKSSLVFGTIAAESQRLINETYSAFVQGFMPTLARPEVDVLLLSLSPPSAKYQSSVDCQCLAGQRGCVVTRQHRHDGGGVVWCERPGQRLVRGDVRELPWRYDVSRRRPGESWRDRHGCDAVDS